MTAIMRAAYIFGSFPVPTQTFAVSDLNALIELGVDVDAFSIKPRPGGVETSKFKGRVSYPKLRRMPELLLLSRTYRRFFVALRVLIESFMRGPRHAAISFLTLPRSLQICAEIDREQPEVVHAFWSSYPLLPLLLLAKVPGPAGRPLLSTFVGAYDLESEFPLRRVGVACADLCFTHSFENLDLLERCGLPVEKFQVVHRGIPVSQFAISKLPREPRSIVSVGALVKDKNFDEVLKACRTVHVLAPLERIDIVGDGPDRTRLEALCAKLGIERITNFPGFVAREKVFELMERSAVFLFLSTKPSERLPNVVKEAMLAGCIVVASRTKGIVELIPDEKFGWIVDTQEEAVDAVRQALALSDDERAVAAARNRSWIIDNFSSTSAMRDYVEAWISHAPRPTAAQDQFRAAGRVKSG